MSMAPSLVYASDHYFAGITTVSLNSMYMNSGLCHANVYVLADGLSLEDRLLISSACPSWVVEYVEIRPFLKKVENVGADLTRVPAISAARLAIDQILPKEIEQVLYIDSDTFVLDSVEDLFTLDLDGIAIAGVKDLVDSSIKTRIGLLESSNYINAGVLLINLNVLRDISFGNKSIELLSKLSKTAKYLDQDAINVLVDGDKLSLPLEYNLMSANLYFDRDEYCIFRNASDYYSSEEYENAIKHPKIIHYANSFTFSRPWFSASAHPYAEVFQNTMRRFGVELFGEDSRSKKQRLASKALGVVPGALKPYVAKGLRKLNDV